jgi:hypothetical protein
MGITTDYDLAVQVADDSAADWIEDGQYELGPRDGRRREWAIHRGLIPLDPRRDLDADGT